MRVLEPHHLKQAKTKKQPKKTKLPWLIVLFALVAAGAGYMIFFMSQESSLPPQPLTTSHDTIDDAKLEEATERELKTLNGEEFKQLYKDVFYPNTQELTEPPEITGNKQADERIRKIAKARGYELTDVPVAAIVKIENEQYLTNDDLLQPLAAEAWHGLKEAAEDDGYPLTITSAYRSIDSQRELFVERLYAHGYTVEELASGQADAAIEETLKVTAIPGYSRHHTGYTIDLWCEDGSGSFLASSCFSWISKNNYQIAMEHQWIPSYPSGTDMQGPEPEPWEYVWVGDAVWK